MKASSGRRNFPWNPLGLLVSKSRLSSKFSGWRIGWRLQYVFQKSCDFLIIYSNILHAIICHTFFVNCWRNSFLLLLFRQINIPLKRPKISALLALVQMWNMHTYFTFNSPINKGLLFIWAWLKQLVILIYVFLSVKLTPELELYQARHPTHCLLVRRSISLALHLKMMSWQINLYICQGQSIFNGLAHKDYWTDANVKQDHHQMQLWAAF